MMHLEFEWDEWNADKLIDRHDVFPDEAEECFYNRHPFQTIKEAAEWAETHDTAPYFDQMEDVPPFEAERPARRTVWLPVQIDEAELTTIRGLAQKRQMDFHDLAGKLLTESLTGSG